MWNYYRDEPNGGAVENVNYSVKDSKSFFDYKTSITGELEGNNTEKEVEIVVPLKPLSHFGRMLDMPLINREVSLILTWFKNCAITSKATIDAEPAINNPTKGKFRITETKLYVLVVTLLTEDGHKLFEQLKTGFKRTIKWNKCRSEVTKKAKTVNLNYLIQHLTESIDYLFFHLKMKMLEHFFPQIFYTNS